MPGNNFFGEDSGVSNTSQIPTNTEKVKVGDKEYSQDDLNNLVGLGEKAREIEKNHGGFDKFVTEYGQTKNKVGQYEKELTELRVQVAKGVTFEELTPEQKQVAKQQIKSLYGDDIMTRQDYLVQRQVEKITEECEQYEAEIDGSDGRPKFDRNEVLEHMKNPDVPKNILKAYKDLHEVKLDEWRSKQVTAAKPKGFYTETGASGSKEPKEVKVTNDNVDKLFYEAVHSAAQE